MSIWKKYFRLLKKYDSWIQIDWNYFIFTKNVQFDIKSMQNFN